MDMSVHETMRVDKRANPHSEFFLGLKHPNDLPPAGRDSSISVCGIRVVLTYRIQLVILSVERTVRT